MGRVNITNIDELLPFSSRFRDFSRRDDFRSIPLKIRPRGSFRSTCFLDVNLFDAFYSALYSFSLSLSRYRSGQDGNERGRLIEISPAMDVPRTSFSVTYHSLSPMSSSKFHYFFCLSSSPPRRKADLPGNLISRTTPSTATRNTEN